MAWRHAGDKPLSEAEWRIYSSVILTNEGEITDAYMRHSATMS